MPSPSGFFIGSLFALCRNSADLVFNSHLIVMIFPLFWLLGSKASFIPFLGLLGGIHRLPLV